MAEGDPSPLDGALGQRWEWWQPRVTMRGRLGRRHPPQESSQPGRVERQGSGWHWAPGSGRGDASWQGPGSTVCGSIPSYAHQQNFLPWLLLTWK